MVIEKHYWAQFSNVYMNRKLVLQPWVLAGYYYVWM